MTDKASLQQDLELRAARRTERDMRRALSLASYPLANILISEFLQIDTKLSATDLHGKVEELLPGFTSTDKGRSRVYDALELLERQGFVNREGESRYHNTFRVRSKAGTPLAGVAAFHLLAMAEYGPWLGAHRGPSTAPGECYARFRVLESCVPGTPVTVGDLTRHLSKDGLNVDDVRSATAALGEQGLVLPRVVRPKSFAPPKSEIYLLEAGEKRRKEWVAPYRRFIEGEGDEGPVREASDRFEKNVPLARSIAERAFDRASYGYWQRSRLPAAAVASAISSLYTEPHSPISAMDMASRLGWKVSTTRKRLGALVEDGKMSYQDGGYVPVNGFASR